MKRFLILITAAAFCVLCGIVRAGENAEYDAEAGATKEYDPGKGPRYEREMREADKEYREGSLTKTEYVQRKREIEKMNP